MRVLQAMVAVATTLVALVVLAPAASAAPATATVRIGGLEYAASVTQGRFGGAATSPIPGAWLATVVHEPLRATAVRITGGSFTLHGTHDDVSGTFVRGTVTPLASSAECGNQRFDVRGTLALRGGGRGLFAVVLTHLRVSTRFGCQPYGAVVTGSLTVPSRTAGT